MDSYLAANRILTSDFKTHVVAVATRLRKPVEAAVRRDGRPIQYLTSAAIDKEKLVWEMVACDRIRRPPSDQGISRVGLDAIPVAE